MSPLSIIVPVLDEARGIAATLAKYADQLADAPRDRAAVRGLKADVAFLEYDWALNDAGGRSQ